MNYTIKNILVPTDFIECSNNALSVAVAMATRHNATLHLLHVVQPVILGRNLGIHGSMMDIETEMIKNTYENLSRHKQNILKLNNLPVNTFAVAGNVANATRDYAEEHDIDIIVMGTHGASGFKEFFIGSNAYDVVKKALCPVLTIPLSFTKTSFDKILYPIRNVDGVVEKYDYVCPIIQKNDSTIHLVGVADENEDEDMYILSMKLKAVKEVVQHNNEYISYEACQHKNIAEKILEVAYKRMDDLMIINATLDKKWYQFFCGTYTQQIVNHSKIPVLSVKPALTTDSLKIAVDNFKNEADYYNALIVQPM